VKLRLTDLSDFLILIFVSPQYFGDGLKCQFLELYLKHNDFVWKEL
jgi:hypothetical protein